MDSPDVPGSSMADAIEAYRQAGQPFNVPHIEIAAWIVNHDLFDVPFTDKVRQCDKQVAQLLQTEQRVTPSGRTVRKWAACRGPFADPETGKTRQRWLWDDAKECSAAHAHAAVAAMEASIETDYAALQETVKGWNEINPNLHDNPIQLSIAVVRM